MSYNDEEMYFGDNCDKVARDLSGASRGWEFTDENKYDFFPNNVRMPESIEVVYRDISESRKDTNAHELINQYTFDEAERRFLKGYISKNATIRSYYNYIFPNFIFSVDKISGIREFFTWLAYGGKWRGHREMPWEMKLDEAA